MHGLFDRFSNAVASHPRRALVLLAVAAVFLASGNSLVGPQAGNDVFLPDDSEVSSASAQLAESFPDSAGLTAVTVIHRGEIESPEGFGAMQAVARAAASDPAINERLALTDPFISPAGFVAGALGVDDLSSVPAEQIAAAVAGIRADPEIGPIYASLVGELDGTGFAIAQIRLRSLGDPDGLADAELHLAELLPGVVDSLDVSTLSPATILEESEDSVQSSMSVLMLIALAVIAVLLFVFFRTGSDLSLSLAGLAITIAGTLGAQGWLGPDGLDVIGLPNQLTTMVPIMLIGLVVDYAIQTVAHYRELRVGGAEVREAVRRGLRGVTLPLGLAAGTTVISFLTNVTSPIPANVDFGIVAAVGVAWGLLVMLVLVPAARALLDGRRERRDALATPRLMSGAIPGAGPLVERIGVYVAHQPMTVLAATGILTIGLGLAASNISTVFDTNDFLPSGGDTLEAIEDLDGALGGQTEIVTVLIEAEITDDRTLRNLIGLTEAFNDELTRPTGAASDIRASLGLLFDDLSTDSGEPGDIFDPLLVIQAEQINALTIDPDDMQSLVDRMQELDPEGFAQVAEDNPNGIDRLMLQFDGLTGDQDRTQQMIDDIEGLWYGDRSQITTTSADVINLEVTEAMTDSQTSSIITTMVAALLILMLFFWATEFKPMLAVIAVFPILLVLIWVLGTMSILGIPYNIITALITALSIGIGVDYTIHIIHRFTEELDECNDVVESTRRTLNTTGSALIGSALTTALGFGVLMLSPLVPFRQFGLVTGITILYALLAAIIVVPPMLVVWAAYHQWRRENIASGSQHGI